MKKYYGPRERLREKGAESLSDEELVTVLLGVHPKRRLAQRLLSNNGSLGELFSRSLEDIEQQKGIGPVRAGIVKVVAEMAVRVWREPARNPKLRIESTQAAYRLMADLASEEQETVRVALLNSQNRLIRQVTVFRGTLNSTVAQPREILREALRANAARFVLGHNHPSQSPEPSPEDLAFTEKMEKAAREVGVPMLDHIIVCLGGAYFSFQEAGFMPSSPSPRLCGGKPSGRSRGNPCRSSEST